MKATLSLIAFLLYASISSAQILPQTPWTWMKGDNTVNQFGTYGTQGVASVNNKPGARNNSTTWRDTTGNLWLFGGSGYSASNSGYLNDLWKFNPSTNQWTWVKGNNSINQFSVYGTMGTANTANKPGAAFSSVSWRDANNNLWLFGGFGYTDNAFGFLNALWKYNPSTNQWTWVKGDKIVDKVGVYGTKGVEHTNNKPGARYGSQTWIDASGNLWLFGGYGYSGSASGILNDIWKYNPSTNKWTWVKGDNAVEQVGVYGTKGIANATNQPGARYVSTSWTDAYNNLWLFGGYGYDETSSGNLNDMWKYNATTNEWTWMSGDKIINQAGVYGTQGQPNMANNPGARYVSSSWSDANGDLWLFGGYGFDNNSNPGYLNDLWKYNTVNKAWTWVKGDNTIDQTGVYGTQGMPDPTNKSGARTGSVSWTDGNGNLWMFGGYGFDGSSEGILNDLWMITNLNVTLPLKLLSFNGALNNNIVGLQWQSEQETAFSHFNIQRSVDGINFTTIGNISGNGNSRRSNYIYTDNDLQNPNLKVFYRLQMVDKDGRFNYSKVLVFDLKQTTTTFTAFPNPAVHSLQVSFTQEKTGNVIISITDMKGVTIKKQTQNIAAGRFSTNIDVSNLAPATYIISLINDKGTVQQKFIKQ